MFDERPMRTRPDLSEWKRYRYTYNSFSLLLAFIAALTGACGCIGHVESKKKKKREKSNIEKKGGHPYPTGKCGFFSTHSTTINTTLHPSIRHPCVHSSAERNQGKKEKIRKKKKRERDDDADGDGRATVKNGGPAPLKP